MTGCPAVERNHNFRIIILKWASAFYKLNSHFFENENFNCKILKFQKKFKNVIVWDGLWDPDKGQSRINIFSLDLIRCPAWPEINRYPFCFKVKNIRDSVLLPCQSTMAAAQLSATFLPSAGPPSNSLRWKEKQASLTTSTFSSHCRFAQNARASVVSAPSATILQVLSVASTAISQPLLQSILLLSFPSGTHSSAPVAFIALMRSFDESMQVSSIKYLQTDRCPSSFFLS